MRAAALPRGATEHRVDRVAQARVSVGDDELHALEPARSQPAQEGQPPGAVLGGDDVEAQDLAAAIVVHADGDEARDVHDAAALAALQNERVEPQVREAAARQRAFPEALHDAVELPSRAATPGSSTASRSRAPGRGLRPSASRRSDGIDEPLQRGPHLRALIFERALPGAAPHPDEVNRTSPSAHLVAPLPHGADRHPGRARHGRNAAPAKGVRLGARP
jgi:hypothetical protein